MLGLSFDENVAPSLVALQRLLDLGDDELRRVIIARPSYLGLDFEDNVQPALVALQHRLGLATPGELRKVVLGLPAILGLSYERNVFLLFQLHFWLLL